MSRGKPTPQSADNLRAFAQQLNSCANALLAVAAEMERSEIHEVVVIEGHAMAYRSTEQYLEKYVQEVRKAFTRSRKERGDFGSVREE